MDTKNDLRIIRTYKSLTEAFVTLLSEKHFEDITINELCERAMIRRTTFYKHFADKYDFLRFFIRQMQAAFDAKNPASADYTDPHSFYVSIMHHVLRFLNEHEKLVNMELGSNLLPTLFEILSEQIASDIAVKIRIGIKKGIEVPSSPEILASFFTGALMYTIRWWLMQKKQLTQEELIREVEKIILTCS